MTDITVFDSQFDIDPGIVTVGLAVGNREYNDINDYWDANFGGQSFITGPSWAYFDNRGPRRFFDDTYSFNFKLRHNVTTIGASSDPAGVVGLKADPAVNDLANFVGYLISPAGSNINIVAQALDNAAVSTVGTPTVSTSTQDIEIEVDYDAGTRIETVTVRDWTTKALIGTSTQTLDSGKTYENLQYFASRDAWTGSYAVTFLGYIDELEITWKNVLADWVLLVVNEGCVVLDNTGLWNKSQQPNKTIIATLGRKWSNVYYDGAGPLEIPLEGILLAPEGQDPCDFFLRVEELLLPAYSEALEVEIYSHLRGYTMINAELSEYIFDRTTSRVDNQDFFFTIRSKRKPDVT